jgi:hypothetical protein
MEELKREARAISSAPILLGSIIILLIVLTWGFTHWAYWGLISARNSHIASLERRVADYRNNLNGASPEEARQRMEALELEVKTLHIRLSPRRLTPVQRQAIADRSRRPAGTPSRNITVTVQESCSDCKAFAAEIAEALHFADNWTVTSQPLTDSAARPPSGLGIRVTEPTRPPPEAVVLQQAFRSAGLAFSMLKGGGSGVELLVTERAPQ